MDFLRYFHFKTLKYDLTNKFLYKNTKKLPALEKIILNFGCKTNEMKDLAISLLALEFVTKKKGSLTITKKSNILIKIRKGNPVGCKVTLYKINLFNFLIESIFEVFPKLKKFNGFGLSYRKLKKNAFSYELSDHFSFFMLENNYHLFNSLPKIDITIVATSKTKEELIFLLWSLQFPIRKKVFQLRGKT